MADLKIAVCEDDPAEYSTLMNLLRESSLSCETEHFPEGSGLTDSFYMGKYDLILMDIYMEGMDGLTAVSRIREQDRQIPIAFLTTSTDHALDGYRYHVNRYLQKPLHREELLEVLELARREKQRQPSVSIVNKGGAENIPLHQIRYAEQQGHSLTLHLTGNSVRSFSMKLQELMGRLPSPPFLQCHKSYLVNLCHVRFLNRELMTLEMMEGGNAYIRRESLRDVENAYRSFMFERTRRSMEETE